MPGRCGDAHRAPVPGPRDTRGATPALPAVDCLVNVQWAARGLGHDQASSGLVPSRVEEFHTCGTAELASGLILILGTLDPPPTQCWLRYLAENILPTICSSGTGESSLGTMPSMHIRGTETKAARQSPEVWSSDILRRRQDQEIKSIIATRPTRIRSWGLHP